MTDHVLWGFHCTALHCTAGLVGLMEERKKLNLLVSRGIFLVTLIIFVNSWDLSVFPGISRYSSEYQGIYQKYLENPHNSCEFCSNSRNYLEFLVIYVILGNL